MNTILTFLASVKAIIVGIVKIKWLQALFAALLASWFTQMLNNKLTKKRERDNKRNEILKNFYYNIIPDIYDYFSVETNFRKGHDIKSHIRTKDIKKRILELISENMLYINSDIHKAYRELRKYKYFEDFSGFHKDIAEVALFYTVVEEYIKLLQIIKYKDTKLLDTHYACLLLIWKNTIAYCGGYGMAYPAISQNFYFDANKLNSKMLKRLKKLDELQIYSDEHKVFFRKILNDLIPKNDIDTKERGALLNQFFENDIEVNDSYSIAVLTNMDIDMGPLTIEFRVQYRDQLLTELYNAKYYKSNLSKTNLTFSKQEFSSLNNELKNAIYYWIDKDMVKLKEKEEYVSLILTATGEDHYEQQFISEE